MIKNVIVKKINNISQYIIITYIKKGQYLETDEHDKQLINLFYKTNIEIPNNYTVDVVTYLDNIYFPITSQYILDGINKICKESNIKSGYILRPVDPTSPVEQYGDTAVIVSIMDTSEKSRLILNKIYQYIHTAIELDLDRIHQHNENRNRCLSG
jgi:hypothetical protein